MRFCSDWLRECDSIVDQLGWQVDIYRSLICSPSPRWLRLLPGLCNYNVHRLCSVYKSRPLDISYTGLEADVAIRSDGNKLVTYKYPLTLALAAPQASRIRLHKLCAFLFGSTVINICKLNLSKYHNHHIIFREQHNTIITIKWTHSSIRNVLVLGQFALGDPYTTYLLKYRRYIFDVKYSLWFIYSMSATYLFKRACVGS